jgi:hypothetical protein
VPSCWLGSTGENGERKGLGRLGREEERKEAGRLSHTERKENGEGLDRELGFGSRGWKEKKSFFLLLLLVQTNSIQYK